MKQKNENLDFLNELYETRLRVRIKVSDIQIKKILY